MRYEEIFHKTRDVLTELAQLCYTQENLIQNLKGDLEDVRKQAEVRGMTLLLCNFSTIRQLGSYTAPALVQTMVEDLSCNGSRKAVSRQ